MKAYVFARELSFLMHYNVDIMAWEVLYMAYEAIWRVSDDFTLCLLKSQRIW